MIDNKTKSLCEVTGQEARELDKMAIILSAKHQAIAQLDTQMIQQILVEELEELKQIQIVEKMRATMLRELSLKSSDLRKSAMLETVLGKDGAHEFAAAQSNFRKSFARVISLNGISRALLKHSLAFIKQNIYILTEGGKRKLVDRKA